MKSIIICEGGTDLNLIEYFLEKTNGWGYKTDKKEIEIFKSVKNLNKNQDILTIGESGGCTKIPKCFKSVIEKNKYSATDEERFNNIVIISDRDEIDTVDTFIKDLNNVLTDNGVDIEDRIIHDKWIMCKCLNGRGLEIQFRILLLIIPFEETGALETFLLDAISKRDSYDKQIIEKGNYFVDTIDPQGKYLTKRRYFTKAKFDIYFSK